MIAAAPDMEAINLGYSFKNIPPCNKRHYMAKLYEKTGKLIERMRWRVFFHKIGDSGSSNSKYSGIFPTKKSAPEDKTLKRFEENLYALIKSIKFKNYKIS